MAYHVKKAIASGMLALDLLQILISSNQLWLPLRKGSGLQSLVAHDGVVCKAGFIAAAASMLEAMAAASACMQPSMVSQQ
jgi:hypothetical protein